MFQSSYLDQNSADNNNFIFNSRFYDRHGNFIKDYPLLNATFHTGFVTLGDNIEYFTQSMIRAGCRAYDSTIDYDVSFSFYYNSFKFKCFFLIQKTFCSFQWTTITMFIVNITNFVLKL